MLETGQPLHAFDLDKVGHKLIIRNAKNNETLKLLDGRVVSLQENTLIIADTNNKPTAIAGVMGSEDSGVTVDTADIVIECAFFEPSVISGVTKRYKVNSEAATRFERGVDFRIQGEVLKHIATTIKKFCGGDISEPNVEVSPKLMQDKVQLTFKKINQVIGTEIAVTKILEILSNLGFIAEELSNDILQVTVPSYRFDIKIAEDVIEEVARGYGYDNIPAIMPTSVSSFVAVNPIVTKVSQLKNLMVSSGFSEIVSYSFIEDKYENVFGLPNSRAVKLQNPIANLNVMRTSLIADLVKSLKQNLSYGHKNIRLFELGRVFYGESANEQPLKLSGLIYGLKNTVNGLSQSEFVDFYNLKSVVENILAAYPDIKFIPVVDYSALHSGRCAKIYSGNTEIGVMGQLHPKICQDFSFHSEPYVFELDFNILVGLNVSEVVLKDINKFPRVERDLAFVIDKNINVSQIVQAIKFDKKISHLIDASIFDIYQKHDEIDTKSVAINFIFQANRTLTDEEIKKDVDIIVANVCSKFNATMRV
jgi:phenylalanyl-tRNA synthetase beta chain